MQEKLLIARNKKGYSKKFVADYLSISPKQYTAKENGDYAFTSDEMFKIANLFGKRLDEIFLPRSHRNGDKNKV